MKVRKPSVGPLVGGCDQNAVRIFCRGDMLIKGGRIRRCHGVLQWRPQGAPAWAGTRYFRLNLNFDMSGVAILRGLTPEATYEYRVGWIVDEADTEDLALDNDLDWSSLSSQTFTVAAADGARSRSVVAGSCRYLLKLLGGAFFDDRGDKAFRSILRLRDLAPLHQLIMVGDQIYADDLGFLNPDTDVEKFYARYREVFTQPYIRQLMSLVPTYMTLDDHEIENDWPKWADHRDLQVKFPAAMHAYNTYQLSHSPLVTLLGDRLEAMPRHNWYHYQDGCMKVFVLDTRTERDLASAPPRIIGQVQMAALKRWLTTDADHVKVVVSSVPVFPDYESPSVDKWSGFIAQRDELIEFIFAEEVRKVVFLSGDVHASMSVELSSALEPVKKIISIVSSSFFWPYPHPSSRQFQLDGRLASERGDFRIAGGAGVMAEDNFAWLDIAPDTVTVRFHARKGDLLTEKVHRF